MKVVAFLPAKGTSERVKNKNTLLLDGKPLFLHTLEKLMKCEFIDEVYLDTESDDIFKIAEYTGCRYLKREPEFASNKTDGHNLFYNEVRKINADIYIQILGTSPFIHPETILKAVDILKNNADYDSVVLVKKEKQYLWSADNKPCYDREHIPNGIDLPDTIIESMGLYVTNNYVAANLKKRYGDRPCLLEADPIEGIDVNFPKDFELAAAIAKGIRLDEIKRLNFLSKIVNSSMISDIMDDIGLNGVVNGMICNLPGTRVFGWAKTLKIRTLNDGEDFNGIYDALESYSQVSDNDIIIVENECGQYAYFGELNSLLSIRAGAAATIVGGVTRDQDATKDFGYPVFSTGYNCKDVRKRATLESINQRIQLFGVSVAPNDLIFADCDGIVIIPAAKERQIMDLLYKKINTENDVAKKIAEFSDPMEIVNTVGAF